MKRIATFMIMTIDDNALLVTFLRMKQSVQYSRTTFTTQVILFFDTASLLGWIVVEEWPISTDTSVFVKRNVREKNGGILWMLLRCEISLTIKKGKCIVL